MTPPTAGKDGENKVLAPTVIEQWRLILANRLDGEDGGELGRLCDMALSAERAERTCLEYCELAGELAAFVEWIVAHDGECLGDHPKQLAYAKRVLEKAKAKRDRRP